MASFSNIEKISDRHRVKTFSGDAAKYIKFAKSRKLSSGELQIAKILGSEGIEYVSEFFFTDLRVKGSWHPLFFDFYLPKYDVCIEFDGEHHYTKKFAGRKMVNVERNDFLKTAYCFKKGIKLLRIKYDQDIEKEIYKFFDKIL